MKGKSLYNRIFAFALSFAMLSQSGFVMPVFAAGTFNYTFNYEEDSLISAEHPVIIPDGDIDPEYGPDIQHSWGSLGVDEVPAGNVGGAIPVWCPEPYRIVGYTFEGWYTADGVKIEKDMPITADMINEFEMLLLYAHWTEYNSPLITSDSLTVSAKNSKHEVLDNLRLTDETGAEVSFSSGREQYYAEVYGDTEYLTLDFEQYEPSASVSVTCNGADIPIGSQTDIKGQTYVYNDDQYNPQIVSNGETVTGKRITTAEDAVVLERTSPEKEYNVIEITVAFDETLGGASKTYTVNVKRLNKKLELAYGNTPYGRIMTSYGSADKQLELKNEFDSTHTYRNNLYVPDAWNPYGDSGQEVVKGTILGENQYINYDKDDTAIVVRSGKTFTDPGLTLYSEEGDVIPLSESTTVKRTIYYKSASSLKYEFWSAAIDAVSETYLTGDARSFDVDILKNENVPVGVYDIAYDYNDGEMTAVRKMIVLPQTGDLNMDNYVNALDSLVYNQTINDDSFVNCLYKYRALDVNNDGAADNADAETVKAVKTADNLLYDPSYAAEEEAASQTGYTPPASASADKAQLYMEFLGTDENSLDAAADTSTALDIGEKLWVGYRFTNTAKLSTDYMNVMTLSLSYDSRYVKPTAAWLSEITQKNPSLSVFEVGGASNIEAKYVTDGSDASCEWSDADSVRTLRIVLFAKDNTFTLADGGYFVKIPFTVMNIPPTERRIFATQLGANSLSMAFDSAYYGYMWDTSQQLNGVSENLMDKLEFMGDYEPVFGEGAAAIPLQTVIYGNDVSVYKYNFGKGTLEGALPEGVTYYPDTNTISGTPKVTGTYEFFINGVKYSLTINKAPLTLTADNKTRTYGDADNPALTFSAEGLVLGDTVDEALTEAPALSCAADASTQYGEETEIKFDTKGASDKYEITAVSGKMTVEKKAITVSSITKIPPCTPTMAKNETFPYTVMTTDVSGQYCTVTGLVNGDTILLSYGATYQTNTEGNQEVSITLPTAVEDSAEYPKSKNYTVTDYSPKTATGVVEGTVIESISMTESCKSDYTYGEPLNLDSGKIRIKYNNNSYVNKTFKEAQEEPYNVKIYYGNTGETVAKHGDKLTVNQTGTPIRIVWQKDEFTEKYELTDAAKLTIAKKDLRVFADDKSRVYGEDNSTLTFTYSFKTEDLAYDDNTKITNNTTGAAGVSLEGYTAPALSCDAPADTETDREKGFTQKDIIVSGGSSDNYNIVCEKGTLTINKRPLTITKITGGVPALTADKYESLKASGTAVAGALDAGETATMEVQNLYNNDPVRLKYYAKYNNANEIDSVKVKITDAEMDDDYGKSYNYTVESASGGNVCAEAEGGRVYVRKINKLEFAKTPKTEYIYGSPVDFGKDDITLKITYDSGEVYDNVTLADAKENHGIMVTYTGEIAPAPDKDPLAVSDSGKKSLTVTPDTIYEDVLPLVTEKLIINPYELTVSADNVYNTYGDAKTEYTYSCDFRYSDTKETVITTAPTMVCKEDNGITEVNQETEAGEYELKISGTRTNGNYTVKHKNGVYVVRQKPLIVKKINNIPVISSADAYKGENMTIPFDVSTNTDNTTLEFETGYAPLWDDWVRITFTASYPDNTAVGETDVNITGGRLIRPDGNARNYYLQSIVTPQKGEIKDAVIEKIEIVEDPCGGSSSGYVYGEKLNLTGSFRITFDSGRVDKGVMFGELGGYGITAKYTSDQKDVKNGEYPDGNRNGDTITISPPADSGAASVITEKLQISKHVMHVIFEDSESVYGNTPSYSFSYDENDIAEADDEEGKTLKEALGDGFTAPAVQCIVNGAEASGETDAGMYEDAITIETGSGESTNYYFVCENEGMGTLTVKRRELTVNEIRSVPQLTTAVIKQNVPPIELEGKASNSDMSLTNLVNNDSVGITYTAVYDTVAAAEKVTAAIKDAALNEEDYPKCKNYILKSVPDKSEYGSVQKPAISKIEILSYPKMDYKYGEPFAISGGRVKLEYNNDESYSDKVSFEQLGDYNVSLTFEHTGKKVINNSTITVGNHNGYGFVLTTLEGLKVVSDKKMTVEKHVMRVFADDKSFVYGEAVPSFTYHFNAGDLTNGDSLTGANFSAGAEEFISALNKQSAYSCMDGDSRLTNISDAGDYVINAHSDVTESDNYIFEIVPGTMTVEKRPLDILSIDSGVPALTSDIIFNEWGTSHKVKGFAATDDYAAKMTVSNLFGGDKVKVSYDALYTSVAAAEDVEVGISSVKMADEYGDSGNYYVRTAPLTARGGEIKDKEISAVEILEQPRLEYTYGEKLNLNGGRVRITYDSGMREERTFANLPADKTKLTYTDIETPVSAEDKLTVKYHNGKSIKISAVSPHEVEAAVSEPLVIHKKKVNVTADEVSAVYGDEFELTYKYSEEDFVYGESSSDTSFKRGLTPPEAVCKDSTGADAGQYSNAGKYKIELTGGNADNYEFIYNSGSLTIERRPMDVNSIDGGVPPLLSRVIREEPSQVHRVSGSAVNTREQMTVSNVVNGDSVKVTYTAVYTGTVPGGNVRVGIENMELDDAFGRSANYYLVYTAKESNYGTISDKEISDVKVTRAPSKLSYTYGETLEIKDALAAIEYDNGEILENVFFDQLGDYGVELIYGGSSSKASEGDRVNVLFHNGKTIVLVPDTPNEHEVHEVGPITVKKKELKVTADNTYSVYGEVPALTFTYDENGFAYNESRFGIDFLNGLTPPTVQALNGENPVGTTDTVGDYPIKVSGGNAANYEFVYTDGILSVTKRPVIIESVNGGIPPLTSDIIHRESGDVHSLAATADMSQMVIANVINGDTLRVNYNAVYTSVVPSRDVTVEIQNASVDEGYEQGRNYYVSKCAESAEGGVIYDKEITSVSIDEQPRLEYTYGDTLNLGSGGVRIEYDSGLIEPDVPFDELDERGITLTYADTEDAAANGDVLTVSRHNGKRLMLTVNSPNNIEPLYTQPLKVNKKLLNVTANNTQSVYGDGFTLGFEYDGDGFVNGDTAKSASFTENLVSPRLVCVDKDGNEAGNLTDAGSYEIAFDSSIGSSDNYEFIYISGTLNIERRTVNITEIKSGIPPLTSDIIHNNPGAVHKLDAAAVSAQMSLENLVNNDDIRVTYKAVYTSDMPIASCTVMVEDAAVDDSYGRSANYRLGTVVETANGGSIHDKEILSAEITQQPRLEYTYGDRLDLSGGRASVTYDNGVVERDIPFGDLALRGITLTYTGTEDTAADGDVLNISYHNGKTITLNARTVHEFAPVTTEPVSIKKKLLTIGECRVDTLIYDGKTTSAAGTITLEGLQNGDTLEVSARFEFEDASAGENKPVRVTDIKLIGENSENYELETDSITAYGAIVKQPVPFKIDGASSSLSEDNTVIVTVPPLSADLIKLGAVYEYSTDGGMTWTKNNPINNLPLGTECAVCVRVAETGNYGPSETAQAGTVKTYSGRVVLRDSSLEIIKTVYTNDASAADKEALGKLFGETGTAEYYSNPECSEVVTYPISFNGEVSIYTIAAKPTSKPSSGGGGTGPRQTSTPKPEQTSVPEETAKPESTLKPTPEAGDSYKPYLSGYENKINPDDCMTRAEAAVIMVKLRGDTGKRYENVFPDVKSGTWYENYIAQAYARGLVSGYNDGLFAPEIFVTREQFASMVIRLTGAEPEAGTVFEDVEEDRWSAGYITAAVKSGIISGYEDGTFKPEDAIRRSEAVRMVNAATGRIADKAEIDKIPCPYIDLPKTHWAYYEFMIASCELKK